MEDDHKNSKVEYLSKYWSDLSKFKTQAEERNLKLGLRGRNLYGWELQINLTSHGRWTHKLKSRISQQLLVRSIQIQNSGSGDQTLIDESCKWRRPTMEGDRESSPNIHIKCKGRQEGKYQGRKLLNWSLRLRRS